MRLSITVTALVAVLAVSACGDDDGEPTGSTANAPTQSTAAKAASPDRRELITLAETYMAALERKDAAAICKTRSAAERRVLERAAGSCEAAFKRALESGVSSGISEAIRARSAPRPEAIVVRGNTARIPLFVPGKSDPLPDIELAARRVGGRWYLSDSAAGANGR